MYKEDKFILKRSLCAKGTIKIVPDKNNKS